MNGNADTPLFSADFMARIERLRLKVRGVFNGVLRAERRSRRLGSGLEFADFRDYTRGDDLRSIDWNIFGRLDRLVVKILEEERDLAVAILLDCSGSMRWAPEGAAPAATKWTLARHLAAALAYLVLHNQDQAGIWYFDNALRSQCGFFRGRAAFHELVRFIEAAPAPSAATSLGASLEAFAARQKRRGVAIVLSDCLDPEGFEKGLAALTGRRFETHVLQILDPAECEPALTGDFVLRDCETDGEMALTATPALLRSYGAEVARFQESVRAVCRKRGAGHSLALAGQAFDDVILRNLRHDRLVQ